ncbi:hypothetical protein SSS_07258 [Sarcoptes scabiei]|nr:hypothetical protein SSS_07258 [Sarcoptes scabiei]KPM03652.1 hypothetical protein QR98_0020860 [Sarcoptes scabiei]UXI18403.1 hypothetical protein NH340_JMT04346 [Sarcoptes scabiei]
MLSKQFGRLLVQNLRAKIQPKSSVRRGHGHGGVPEEYKDLVTPTMNDGYPLPTLLYSEEYAKCQAKYNKMLAAASVWLLSAMIWVYVDDSFGYISAPPKKVNIPLDQLN